MFEIRTDKEINRLFYEKMTIEDKLRKRAQYLKRAQVLAWLECFNIVDGYYDIDENGMKTLWTMVVAESYPVPPIIKNKYLPNWLKWLEIIYDLEDVGEQYPKVKIRAEQLNICEE